MGERTGRCLCGAVQLVLRDPGHALGACHCRFCRAWTSASFMTLAILPAQLRIVGEKALKTYRSSDWAERAFCGTCGSPVWYRFRDRPEAEIYLSAGLLDDLSGMVLEHEVYFDKKPAAWSFAGETRKLTEADAMAAYDIADPAPQESPTRKE